MSKYKNVFAKGYLLNWSEEVVVIKKVKTVVVEIRYYDINGEEIVGTFNKNELQKQIKENLELQK